MFKQLHVLAKYLVRQLFHVLSGNKFSFWFLSVALWQIIRKEEEAPVISPFFFFRSNSRNEYIFRINIPFFSFTFTYVRNYTGIKQLRFGTCKFLILISCHFIAISTRIVYCTYNSPKSEEGKKKERVIEAYKVRKSACQMRKRQPKDE